MTGGYVCFRLGERTYAAALDGVREVMRLTALEGLPGTEPALAGVLMLRGSPLPVYDVRARPGGPGDVLVLGEGDDAVGVAVDQVRAVLAAGELTASAERPAALPAYVLAVLRHQDEPVLLVDLRLLLRVAERPAYT